MQLIKFITAGNVDDGKSTLIGRLLYDSNAISNDILETLQLNNGEIDFANFTDGLKAEREQGITIDVAYKYFETQNTKFIIADCPGHIEYTKNMITGASHSDVAIIIIDVTIGITEQTKRHIFIADLMNIPYIIFCVNKMDVINYQQDRYIQIVQQLKQVNFINNHKIDYIPISALQGDNVVHSSKNIHWYKGQTLLNLLERYQPEYHNFINVPYIQVQYIALKNNERYFFGTLLGGTLKINQEITIYPTQQTNKIKQLFALKNEVVEAYPNQPITLTLNDDTEIQRGYYLVATSLNKTNVHEQHLNFSNQISTICIWFDQINCTPNKRYYLQHHSFKTYVKLKSVQEILDLHSLDFKPYDNSDIHTNTIFKANLITAQPLLFSDYTYSTDLGSFIIIDENSLKTVGAGIIVQ